MIDRKHFYGRSAANDIRWPSQPAVAAIAPLVYQRGSHLWGFVGDYPGVGRCAGRHRSSISVMHKQKLTLI